jgi:hypothetical protein
VLAARSEFFCFLVVESFDGAQGKSFERYLSNRGSVVGVVVFLDRFFTL